MKSIAFAALIACTSAARADYQVDIDTGTLSGSSLALAFDFIDGGPPSNSASVGSFSGVATFGPITPSGGVTGSLPSGLTLTDSSFFNEYLQVVTAGPSISFALAVTANAPTGLSLPDTFSFFLLDPVSGSNLFSTTDPTGADSLFTVQIDGSGPDGTLTVFGATASAGAPTWTVADLVSVAPVPEPAAVWLFLLGATSTAAVALRRTAKKGSGKDTSL